MPMRKLARFTVVGGLGFLVDATVLSVLVHAAGSGPYAARMFSFLSAVTVTWYLNRNWTFRTDGVADRHREYSRYIGVQVAGALINLGIYAILVQSFEWMARIPVMPLAIGAVIAMLFNYGLSRKLVFVQ
jgi:putative flippase GtrA